MMDNWYTVNLGDGIMAAIPSAEIEQRFQRLFTSKGNPSDMAVFTRLEPEEGHLHCQVKAYFSPATKEVAIAFDAQPCTRPSHVGLDLLAGDEHAWSALFPEKS